MSGLEDLTEILAVATGEPMTNEQFAAIDALVAEARAEGAAEVRARVEAVHDRWAKIHNRLHEDVTFHHRSDLIEARDHVRIMHDELTATLDGDQEEGDHA